jgi:signal transduction histidine kinase
MKQLLAGSRPKPWQYWLTPLKYLLATWWIALAMASSGVAGASTDAKSVLFLEDDEPGRPAYQTMMGGFRQSLAKSLPGRVAIYQENLDLGRISHPDYQDQTLQWLRQKYQGKKIDVVVACGPASMKLASKSCGEFWPDARMIWLGSKEQQEMSPGETAPVALLTVKLDVARTLDAARTLMPGASRLVVVGGSKASYAGMKEFFLHEAEAAAARHGLAMESLAGLPLAETCHRLSLLPRDVMVLYGFISLEGEGRAYTPREAMSELSRASGAPIFGLSKTLIGYGMTGGVMLRPEQMGRELADMTAEALTAPPGKAVASRESRAQATLFDWRELQRFGLSPERLPEGAEILFAPPSLWKTHRNAVLGAIALLGGETVLIGAFIVQLRRRRKAEQKVLLQRDQLAHVGRVSSLGQLAASIAHELNQPLGAILRNAGAAERLLEKAEPDLRELRAIVADIRADDSRASTVIERMRVLLTRQALDFKALDLKEVLDEVAGLLNYEAMKRGVALQVVTAPGLPSVHGDRVHLQQMVINLVLNAMDAVQGKPDGAVVLEAEGDASTGLIMLRVRDNGQGIPESLRSTLFEPFQSSKPAGMGMGLAISQTIAEAHEGVLQVESSSPAGTCFCCTLHPSPFPVPA